MDLLKAIESHVQWKTKFRMAIQNQANMDAATISKDNCCEIGKWLYGAGKKAHGHLPSFQAVVREHAAFHKVAGAVAGVVNAKKYAEAEKLIGSGSEFAKQSSAVGVAITRLKVDAKL